MHWQEKYSEPVIGDGGRVVYHYGDSLHTIVCSPLNVCDVELQAGEVMRPPQIGDSVRWIVTPTISGESPNQIPHLIIKPKAANLTTTMVVPTNRRTYRFQLKSTEDAYMGIISFTYTEDTQNAWLAYQVASQQQQEQQKLEEEANSLTVDDKSWFIDDLDFDYKISGDDVPWKPIRVFNNGLKTIIQMPYSMKQTEAPAFLGVDSSGDEEIINYRIRDDKYIVDKIFDEGILIVGVGRKQLKVKILRENKTYSNKSYRKFRNDRNNY